MMPWLPFSEEFACPGNRFWRFRPHSRQLDRCGHHNNMLALGTLLDSDEIQGSVLLSNLEGLA